MTPLCSFSDRQMPTAQCYPSHNESGLVIYFGLPNNRPIHINSFIIDFVNHARLNFVSTKL